MQKLERALNTSSPIAFLKPRFQIVGSAIEGTRIHSASEVDVPITFEFLEENPFQIGKNATELKVPENVPELDVFATDGVFDYGKFLELFLQSIETCLREIKIS